MQAVERAFSVLEAVASQPLGMGVTEIANAVALEKPVVVRYVRSLEALGYLIRNPENKRYRLGARMASLGFASLRGVTVVDVARPFLKSLAERAGETADLAIREGTEAVFVWVEGVVRLITVSVGIGIRLPLHVSANGKALLMDMDEAELGRLLGAGPYPKLGPNSITDLAGLTADILGARARGYAINDEELEVGHRSVGAPVRDAAGAIVGAVGISGPSSRISRQDLVMRYGPLVAKVAGEVSTALGARANK